MTNGDEYAATHQHPHTQSVSLFILWGFPISTRPHLLIGFILVISQDLLKLLFILLTFSLMVVCPRLLIAWLFHVRFFPIFIRAFTLWWFGHQIVLILLVQCCDLGFLSIVQFQLTDHLGRHLKTTKDSWTYQGTVSAGSDNKVAVEVGQGVTWQLTADTNVNTLVNNGTIVTNGYTLNVSGSSSGTGTISETTGISSLITPADDNSAARYTLDGRRALSTHKGIIIQNGQKYVSE